MSIAKRGSIGRQEKLARGQENIKKTQTSEILSMGY
jgi:hypothetical protein